MSTTGVWIAECFNCSNDLCNISVANCLNFFVVFWFICLGLLHFNITGVYLTSYSASVTDEVS